MDPDPAPEAQRLSQFTYPSTLASHAPAQGGVDDTGFSMDWSSPSNQTVDTADDPYLGTTTPTATQNARDEWNPLLSFASSNSPPIFDSSPMALAGDSVDSGLFQQGGSYSAASYAGSDTGSTNEYSSIFMNQVFDWPLWSTSPTRNVSSPTPSTSLSTGLGDMSHPAVAQVGLADATGSLPYVIPSFSHTNTSFTSLSGAPASQGTGFQSSHQRGPSLTLSLDIQNQRLLTVGARSNEGSVNLGIQPSAMDIDFYGEFDETKIPSVADLMRFVPLGGSTHLSHPSVSPDIPGTSTNTPGATPDTGSSAQGDSVLPASLPVPGQPSLVPSTPAAPAPPATPSSGTVPAADRPPINVSSFLPPGVVHGDLHQTRAFAIEVFKSDKYDADSRRPILQDYAVNVLVKWGTIILAHDILSGSGITPDDVPAHLVPFFNSMEVTILICIIAQFSLASSTLEGCRGGWRYLFRDSPGQVAHYETRCVTPASTKLQDFFMSWFIAICQFTIVHVLRNPRIFPEFSEQYGISGEVMRAILEYAASGGYLHWFAWNRAIYDRYQNYQEFELFLHHPQASIDLVIIRGLVENHPGSSQFLFRYFRHLSLAYISNFNVDWLSNNGATIAVHMFVQQRNPLIRYAPVTGLPALRFPSWISLTNVSSGVISVVLASLEQMGADGLTAQAIARDAEMMVLYGIKVACTGRLIHELWNAPHAHLARDDIAWVSGYNFWKADMATRPTRRITNAPSLYVAIDPTRFRLGESQIRASPVPNYTANDFMEEVRKLQAVDGRSMAQALQCGPELAALIDKGYRIAGNRQIDLGSTTYARVEEDLRHLEREAYNTRSEHAPDPEVSALQKQLTTLEIQHSHPTPVPAIQAPASTSLPSQPSGSTAPRKRKAPAGSLTGSASASASTSKGNVRP